MGSHAIDVVENASREYAAINKRTREWITAEPASRLKQYEVNRRWFTEDGTFESSIFLYFDLSASSLSVARSLEIQNSCVQILGEGNFNSAPAERIHCTIFTAIVLNDDRLPDSEVHRTAKQYKSLIESVRQCSIAIGGPRLTAGGVILECRIYEPSIQRARDTAPSFGPQSPRVPKIDYATIGYITGGDQSDLCRLDDEFSKARESVYPIIVSAKELYVTLTVNKHLVQPTISYDLPESFLMTDKSVLAQVKNDRERDMLGETMKFERDKANKPKF